MDIELVARECTAPLSLGSCKANQGNRYRVALLAVQICCAYSAVAGDE